ncbi:hypothetical protein [uncultured Croceicoccus sp.]|uniref:hypothetical protein n=1 Tax=uncultured Croceicoccus sp. TaxID=1295329 RepID=UPI002611AAEC|nr:hypothetical protein [uncultured Croceicoccus sp.]
MSMKLSRQLVTERAFVHTELPAAIASVALAEHGGARTHVDRSFELPTGLYAVTVGAYLAYLAVMGLGLSAPGLAIPMAIFFLFVIAGFGVPALWVRMKPDHGDRPLDWAAFRRDGIMTMTGRMEAGAATVQVVILPVLILGWGVGIVTIRAMVG